ncbi:MAG: hypothetical protein E6G57_07345 [Actinobacteria bacterium]|nr:MAG: hypothetical protein E6G57_07345 [Actinomycetota bacterium]
MSRAFFETVEDALHGFLPPAMRDFESHRTSMNLKVWYDEGREHYEVQLVSGPALEVGFHAEHKDAGRNEEILDRLVGGEKRWRKVLGRAPKAGAFVGRQKNWRRVSEVWDGDGLTEDAAVEAAERRAAYIEALEPLRRGSTKKVRA